MAPKMLGLFLVVLAVCAIIVCCEGSMFDFHVIEEEIAFEEGEKRCRLLGYDGLAIVSSPEAYKFAMEITQKVRVTRGIWIGLRYNMEHDEISWEDGTVPTTDMPWDNNRFPEKDPRYRCARISRNNYNIKMIECTAVRFPLCRSHDKTRPFEAVGAIFQNVKPESVINSLSVDHATSYVTCAVMCSSDYRCRLAMFNSDFLTCTLLGPGMFEGITGSQVSTLFYRPPFKNE